MDVSIDVSIEQAWTQYCPNDARSIAPTHPPTYREVSTGRWENYNYLTRARNGMK